MYRFSLGASALALALPLAAHAQSTPDPLTDTIVVTGTADTGQATIAATTAGTATADATAIAARLPGAGDAFNGPLSGRLQYRGVTGDRLLVRIDGQRFESGSPNEMDPPLHYAPLPLLESITVDRGVSPVRDGPGLGGGFDAHLKSVPFGASGALQPYADLSAGYDSSDTGWSGGGIVGLANDRYRIGFIGSHEEGGDTRIPGGRIRDTSYARDVYGVEAGMKTASGELDFEVRQQDTGHAGTPALPMDIVFFHTTFANMHGAFDLTDRLHLDVGLGYNDVSHAMDNFTSRPAPAAAMMFRRINVHSDSFTGHANFTLGSATRHFGFGADFEAADRDARVVNPNNAGFYVDAQPHVVKHRVGAYLEWRGGLGPVKSEIGARIDHHEMSAGIPLVGPALPMGARMLAAQFIAGPRDWSDDTVDVVARFWSHQGAFTPRLTLARKTRAPSAIERFAWLPIEASGGLADGNVYIGDPTLRPEIAYIAEAGVDWAQDGFYARPSVYYRRIDHYIQGVPYDATPGVVDSMVEMVASMNGDASPLRFANVDAEIYGADLDFGTPITSSLQFDGTATYVRGKRRDISDNLYRIAPPNLRLDLTWSPGAMWSLTAEGVGYAAQRDVSVTNGEQSSDGYVIANVFGHVTPIPGLTLSAGVENLFDRRYAPHLAGYNRVMDSDVPVGARLPAPRRSAFVRAQLRF
ncbi:TonB-dependent receptor [Porphyrobacter algicida]|uniref:TonB-dependent receptor n=1 Tax=Qipengyuania algicida TaxID=1836209 RepID=A0A845AKE5_9SPHN|nr:TonB-dependent receptor [Qipengyuania algicida]MXP27528.1 TonB-dependent receptor [Qipengyuania algicida]